MAVTYLQSANTSVASVADATYLNITKPSGLATDDLVILYVTGYHNGGALTVTFPAGFTVVTADNFLMSAPDGVTGKWAWKIATGSEPATYDVLIGGSATLYEAEGTAVAFTGVNTTTPIAASAVTTNTTGNSTPILVALTGVTAVANGAVAYYAILDETSGSSTWSFTPPSGYTERVDVNQPWAAATLATLDNTSAGATGTLTSTATRNTGSDTAGFAGWVIAINPSSTAAQFNGNITAVSSKTATITTSIKLNSTVLASSTASNTLGVPPAQFAAVISAISSKTATITTNIKLNSSISNSIVVSANLTANTTTAKYRAHTVLGSSTTSNTRVIDKPAGTLENDLIIIALADDWLNPSITWPSGFTQGSADFIALPDSQLAAWAWKVAGASEPSTYTITASTQSFRNTAVVAFSFYGINSANPIVEYTKTTDTNGNTPPVSTSNTSVTLSTNDALVWLAIPDVTVAGATTSFTPPSGFTEYVEYNPAAWVSISAAVKESNTSGATGSVSGTINSTTVDGVGYVSYLIGIKSETSSNSVIFTSNAAAKTTISAALTTNAGLQGSLVSKARIISAYTNSDKFMELGVNSNWNVTWERANYFSNIARKINKWTQVVGSSPYTEPLGKGRGQLNPSNPADEFRAFLSDVGDGIPSGLYTVIWTGTGNLGVGGYSGISTWYAPGTFTFNYTKGDFLSVWFKGTALTSLKIILPGQVEANVAGNEWDSNYIAWYQSLGLRAMRGMDWYNTSKNFEEVWSDRVPPTAIGWENLPYEVQIDFANRTNSDIWLNIPARADDNYITQLGLLINSNLNTGLRAYIELGNEIWNTGDPWGDGTAYITYLHHPKRLATGLGGNLISSPNHQLVVGDRVNFLRKKGSEEPSDWTMRSGSEAQVVSVPSADTFTAAQTWNLAQLNSTIVGEQYMFVAQKDDIRTNINVNFATRFEQATVLLQAVCPRNKFYFVLGTFQNSTWFTQTRIQTLTNPSNIDYFATAPYSNGKHWGAQLICGNNTVQPQISDTNTLSNIKWAIYPNAYNATIESTKLNVGTLHSGSIIAAGSYPGSFIGPTIVSGLTNNIAYKCMFVATHTYAGMDVETSVTIPFTLNGTAFNLIQAMSNSDKALLDDMALVDDYDINTEGSIESHIAVASGMNYIAYEGGPHEDRDRPAEIQEALFTYYKSAEAVGALKRVLGTMAIKGLKKFFFYKDVSKGYWGLTREVSDLADNRYNDYRLLQGKIPAFTQLAKFVTNNTTIPSQPAFPYIITNIVDNSGSNTLDSGALNYSIVSGNSVGRFSISSAGELSLINDLGINWSISTAYTLILCAKNDYTSYYNKVVITLGGGGYTGSIFSNIKAVSKVIGANLLTGTLGINAKTILSGTSASTNTVTTSSILPKSNTLYLLSVLSRTDINFDPVIPTILFSGITWELVQSVVVDPISTSRRRLSVFRALSPITSTNTLSINFGGQSQTYINYTLDEISNIRTTGLNGSDAIGRVNYSTDNTELLNTLSLSMGTYSSISNATYGIVSAGNSLSEINLNPAFSSISSTGGFQTLNTKFSIGTEPSIPVEFSSNTSIGIIGIELVASSVISNALYTNILVNTNANGALTTINTMLSNAVSHSSLSLSLSGGGSLIASINTHNTTSLNLINKINLNTNISSVKNITLALTTKASINNLINNYYQTTQLSTYNTEIVSPSSNILQLLTVVSSNYLSINPNIPSVSGNNLTWELVVSDIFDTTGITRSRVSIFRALSPIPTTGSITIHFGAQLQDYCSWNLDEITGTDISGLNGVNSIVQLATSKDETNVLGTILSTTLPSAVVVNNRTYAVLAANSIASLTAIDSQFNLIANSNFTSPGHISTLFSYLGDNTVESQWDTSSNLSSIILEIAYSTSISAASRASSNSTVNITTDIKVLSNIYTTASVNATLTSVGDSFIGNIFAKSTLKGTEGRGALLQGSVKTTNAAFINITNKINLNSNITSYSSIVEADIRVTHKISSNISSKTTTSLTIITKNTMVATILSKSMVLSAILDKNVPEYNTISADIQRLDPSVIIDMYEVDTTSLPGGGYLRFHAGVSELSTEIVWQGNIYTSFPVEITGFEYNSEGASPRPKLSVANVSGLISKLAYDNNDLIGLKVVRKRTFKKYLDRVNFPGGVNPYADPNAHFTDEIYYIDRKSMENKLVVEFELVSALDLQGIMLPRRQVLTSVCTWKYRGADCSYTGPAVATQTDTITTDILLDKCGKRLTSCRFRFGTGILPFGGFPAAGKIE